MIKKYMIVRIVNILAQGREDHNMITEDCYKIVEKGYDEIEQAYRRVKEDYRIPSHYVIIEYWC